MKLLGFSIFSLALLPDALSLPDSKQRSLATNDAPIVDLGYAQYQGVFDSDTNTTSYLGVRYAAPPVGEHRWQAPQAPADVSGVQQADTQPQPCFQSMPGVTPLTESEDCLFLNVYFPGSTNPASNGTLLPTVVWIHGGGYLVGSATVATGEGSDLIQESNHEAVVVIIQYRLGIFGFLAGNQVKENGALNAGLLDQNFALRWVNQHISKFGGDPAKVTIWGESAGAGSVIQHIIAEDGETTPQLFRAAMTSSTFLPSLYVFNDAVPQTLYNQVVDKTNCTSSSDSLACLRQVDSAVLQTANIQLGPDLGGPFTAAPVIDGTFIRQRPTEALRQGKLNGVRRSVLVLLTLQLMFSQKALLAVTNADEGSIFVDPSAPLNASAYASQIFPKLGQKELAAIEEAYGGLGSMLNQNILINGEALLTCPTYYLLKAFQGRSWKGEFAIPPGVHGLDLDYYYPTGKNLTFNNATFITSFGGSFMSFAVSLDPNIKVDPVNNITPEWPIYNGEEMKFNQTQENTTDIRLVTTDQALLERCRLWESFGELTGQ
ncbi:hypothetical protein VNI00_013197 [Paramarasmius palmivorus]|uniref:Carboxylic ester hydrolase n=1 Tax=Paramarasmius palmivorus TaxID=297713 RepID=A0AAW0C1I6_9AGAR